MNLSYIKLSAKRQLVGNNIKCFFASVLPIFTFSALTVSNYYLYRLLAKINMPYDVYLKPAVLTLSLIISFFIYIVSKLISERYFYMKSRKITAQRLNFRQCFTATVTAVLKFFLSVAWSAVYYFPSAIMLSALYIAENYSRNVRAALIASSAVLFLIGTAFLYVTLKRYSMCYAVILADREKDSLKIIEKSILLTDGNMVKYSAFSLSFLGWTVSCVFILPLFYVLPYRKMAQYSFYNSLTEEETDEKPVIFYITKKAGKNYPSVTS